MLKELLSIFRGDDPLGRMANDFSAMLGLAREMTVTAGGACFEQRLSTEGRTALYKQDVEVNKLERKIRKAVIAHLSIAANISDLPYCLLLMSLVKDVERIGDYAKNLAEVPDYHPDPLSATEVHAALLAVRQVVEKSFGETMQVFSNCDRDRALELIRDGKGVAEQCEALIHQVAAGTQNAATTTALVLAIRYYKRIGGHLLNVLSSVVMPLHKLDYYDERELDATERDPAAPGD